MEKSFQHQKEVYKISQHSEVDSAGQAVALPAGGSGNQPLAAVAAAAPAAVPIEGEKPDKRTIFGFLGGWLAFFLILFLPTPEGMQPEGMKALAVVSWAVIIWVTEAVPVGLTGLIIPMMLFVTKALPKLPDAFGGFTAHTTYLCLGAFIFSAMMQLCGLDRRISVMCLNLFKVSRVDQLIRAMFLNNFILAVLIPATAARGATLLPIIRGFLSVFDNAEGEKNAKASA